MPAINLTWYSKQVKRIMRDVKALNQKEIAEIEGVTRQAVSKKMVNASYNESLVHWIQILDLAGYEIKEKEET